MTPIVLLAASAFAAPMLSHPCDLRDPTPSPYVTTPACECVRRGELFWYAEVDDSSDPYGIDESCFEATEQSVEAVPVATDPARLTILKALVSKAWNLAYAVGDVFVHDDAASPPDQLMSGEMGSEEDHGPPPQLFPIPGGFDVLDGQSQQVLARLTVGAAPVVEAHLVENPGGQFDDLLVVLADGAVWVAPGPLVGLSYSPPI